MNTAERILEFCEVLTLNSINYYSEHYPNLLPPIYYPDDGGRKFTRIVHDRNNGSRSVECFVDRETGDVIKSAGWKAPQRSRDGALAVRYNLHDEASRDALYAVCGKVSGYLYA